MNRERAEYLQFYNDWARVLLPIIREQRLKRERERIAQSKARQKKLSILRTKQLCFEILGAGLIVASFNSVFLLLFTPQFLSVELGEIAIILCTVLLLLQNKRLRRILWQQ